MFNTKNNIQMIEDFNKDFTWVIKVLKSCKRQGQLDTTENCYKQFKQKWSKFFNSKNSHLDELTYNCEEEFQIILNQKRNTLGWT